jgi:hypothetical protein
MKGNVQLMRTINFIIVIIYLPIIAFFLVKKITLNQGHIVKKITLNQGHIRELNHESLLKIGFKEREPKPIINEEFRGSGFYYWFVCWRSGHDAYKQQQFMIYCQISMSCNAHEYH